MIKFKGWLSMKQYMPMKPIKRGIKVWNTPKRQAGLCVIFKCTREKTRWHGRVQFGLSCYCGTTRVNRKDIPKELAVTNREVKALRQGGSISCRKNNLVATAWKDKKVVHFLSTQSNPVGNDTVNHKQRGGTVIQVRSAPVVKCYNRSMGGVDLHDQLHGYYAIRTRKWWWYLFWFCVDVSTLNAFILERKAINHHSRTQLDFQVDLASAHHAS